MNQVVIIGQQLQQQKDSYIFKIFGHWSFLLITVNTMMSYLKPCMKEVLFLTFFNHSYLRLTACIIQAYYLDI